MNNSFISFFAQGSFFKSRIKKNYLLDTNLFVKCQIVLILALKTVSYEMIKKIKNSLKKRNNHNVNRQILYSITYLIFKVFR